MPSTFQSLKGQILNTVVWIRDLIGLITRWFISSFILMSSLNVSLNLRNITFTSLNSGQNSGISSGLNTSLNTGLNSQLSSRINSVLPTN